MNNLEKIAKQMVAPGKGILAADESIPTAGKLLARAEIENTDENRRAWRETLFTTPGIGEYISGVILFDETIRQSSKTGDKFVSILENERVLPGIKVDQSTTAQENSPNEKVTKGLDDLPERLKEYVSLGAKFAKWRAVITINEDQNLPTEENIKINAKDLAQYAKDCQEAGLVPIVEPEVLMDGNHTLETCAQVTEKTLMHVFEELRNLNVKIEEMILKPNMIVPGKESGQKSSAEEIAKVTVDVFKKVLPNSLPGVVFLSGGQDEIEATENLNAMHRIGELPWSLSFSFGRALQISALKTWDGKEENVSASQKTFLHRAKMNSLAILGKYSGDLEN